MIGPTPELASTLAMDARFEQAKTFFLEGLAHYEAGRLEEAERQFAASLSLMPGRASTLTNLGATRLKLGKLEDAVDLLDEALAQEPDNAEALAHHAAALAELGRTGPALVSAERALKVNPRMGVVWTVRGNLLKELGRTSEAADSYRSAIEHGADAELNRYYLAALNSGDMPRQAPRPYVQALFDGYAEDFETHLTGALNYRAPDVLVARLQGRRFHRALDLGCGTGLCGIAARQVSDEIDGIDVSANMVARAEARGVYRQVIHGDLAQWLAGTTERYDLVLAADVFIYVGALEQVFSGVSRVLNRGGVFAFSVELADEGHDLQLRASLRYAHSRGYIHQLADQHGFEILDTAEHPIRDDQRTPIAGLFAWLVKP
jgi:predicted TPR repeat methyltransferase